MTRHARVAGAALAAVAISALFVSGAFAQATFAIELTKEADKTTVPAGGGEVNYTFWVENTGEGAGGSATLKTVELSDSHCTPVFDATSDAGADGDLDVGETWKWTCTETITATTTNTATAFACKTPPTATCDAGNHDTGVEEDSWTVTVGTATSTVDDVAKGAGAAMIALILLAIGGLGFLGTTNRLPKLPRIG